MINIKTRQALLHYKEIMRAIALRKVWLTPNDLGNATTARVCLNKAAENGVVDKRPTQRGWRKSTPAYEYKITEQGLQVLKELGIL